MTDTLFELSDFEQPVSFIPACFYCGAKGDPIVIDGEVVRDWRAAAIWSELAIAEHMRAFHPEHLSPWMRREEDQ